MPVSMDPSSVIQSLQTIDQQLQADLSALGGDSQQGAPSLGTDASSLASGQKGGLRDLVQALDQLVKELMQMEQQQAQQSSSGDQAAQSQASPDQAGGAASQPGAAGGSSGGSGGAGGAIGKIVQVLQQIVADVGQLLGGSGGASQA